MTQTRRWACWCLLILVAVAAVAMLTSLWGRLTRPVAERRLPPAAPMPAQPPAATAAPSATASSASAGVCPATPPVVSPSPRALAQPATRPVLPPSPTGGPASRRTASDPGPQLATAEGVLLPPDAKTDRYIGAKVLDEKIGPVGPDGSCERVRVVLTDMKYPLVRVVERWQKESVQYSGVSIQKGGVRSPASGVPHSDTLLSQTAMVADHVTVKVREGVTEATLAAAVAADNGRIVRKLRVPGPGVYLVQFPEAQADTVPHALAALARQTDAIAAVEPDFVVYACDTTPNDPMFGELWGMKNTGQIPYSSSIIGPTNSYSALFMTYSPTTSTNGVTGLLHDCGYGATNEFPAGASGYIALIRRGATNNGTMTFAEKATNAKAAGAAAAIICNNVSGDLRGTLGGPGDWIPAVGVADTVGEELLGSTNRNVTVLILPAPVPGDIRATPAWDNGVGSREVLVGVIDSGIDYTHEDLKDNVWINPGETGLDASGHDKRHNGVDDDGNGYADDWHGWDFCNDDNDPMDDHYHGTHCAGTIGGVGNNNVGVAGACWRVSMVGLKFLSRSGSGLISDAMEAVYYATRLGAKLTSNSWGGGAFSQTMYDAITDAGSSNVLFVAAAGNNGWDNDVFLTYPASYDCANIIAVAATDSGDEKAYFSNYGAATVDLGAPGVGILSCQPGNKYQLLSGTSMATPHVAGACALAWSRAPYRTAAQIKSAVLSAVDPVPGMTYRSVTGGRLNTAKLGLTSVTLVDWTFGDASGNTNGVIEPDEIIDLTLTFRNSQTNTAEGVQANLTALTNGTVLAGTAGLGTLTNGAVAVGVFQVRALSGMTTPGSVRLQVAITDNAGGLWQFPLSLPVYRTTVVSGTASLDGAPAAGVTATFDGLFPVVSVTDAQGHYSASLVAGEYAVRAARTNWLETAVQSLATTSSVMSMDFPFTTATVSGQVKDALTLDPISGAVVEASGPFTQSATSDVSGAYAMTHVYGRPAAVALIARKTGVYLDSETRTITLPPDAPNTDFVLGVAEINISPLSLDVHVEWPGQTNGVLTISETGGSALKWRIAPEIQNTPERAAHAGERMRTELIPTNAIGADGTIFGATSDGASLWVLAQKTFPGIGGSVRRLDPRDLSLVATYDVSSLAPFGTNWSGIAFLGTNLWVCSYDANGGKMDALDPVSGQFVRSIPLPAEMFQNANNTDDFDGFAAGGGAFWMKRTRYVTTQLPGGIVRVTGTTNIVYKISPEDGALLQTLILANGFGGLDVLTGLAYRNGSLWTSRSYIYGKPVGHVTLFRLNPVNGAVVSRFDDAVAENCALGALCPDGAHGLWLLENRGVADMGEWAQDRGHRAYLVDTGEPDVWLRALPDWGTTPGLSTSQVAVAFDSAVAGPGVSHATLEFQSNDPAQPRVTVLVTLTVTSPLTLSGNVTMDGQPLANATVRYAGPYAGSVLSDSSGNYTFHAATGTYAVVAGKGDYRESAPRSVTVPPGTGGVDFAFTSATISGTVRDAETLAPVSGATITYAGPISGAVQTATDGTYSIDRVYGQTSTLTLTAKKPGVYDETSRSVTVPPGVATIDFRMGVSRIAVSPASFDVEAPSGSIVTQTLTVANTGNATLVWSTWSAEEAGSQGRGTVVRTLTLPWNTYRGIALDGASLWVDANQSPIRRFNPSNGELLGTLTPEGPPEELGGMAWDGASLWVTDVEQKRAIAIGRETGVILRSIATGGYGMMPNAIAVGGGALWAHSKGWHQDRIYRMDLADGTPQGWTQMPPGLSEKSLYSLTWFNDGLWLAEYSQLAYDGAQTNRIFKLNPADGSVMASFVAPDQEIIGLGSDGIGRLWAVTCPSFGEGMGGVARAYLIDTGEIAWMDASPASGTVPSGSATHVSLVFDTSGLAKGAYTSLLHVASSDSLHPDVTVTTVLHVISATAIETEQAAVSVPEGGAAGFRVRLAKRPPTAVSVTVTRTDGDADITVQSGATLLFDANNWNTYQTVVLAAAEDADTTGGHTMILLSGSGMDSVPVTAIEADNDTVLRIYAGVGGSVAPAGSMVVTKGAAVQIAATAYAGCGFSRWFAADGSAAFASPGASNTTVTISAPAMIRATFSGSANLGSTKVWSWGYGASGQIGDGTNVPAYRYAPVPVQVLSNVAGIAAGEFCSLARRNDGRVWAWGQNGNGQLGDGTKTNRFAPVPAQGISNVTAISAGQHSMALTSNGTVWAWGANNYGQLGDGTKLDRHVPVPTHFSNVTAVAAGYLHALALASDSTVMAVGGNYYGQLGDGTTVSRTNLVPVRLSDNSVFTNVAAIAAGGDTTLAIKQDGTVWQWGGNSQAFRRFPEQVRMPDGTAFSNVTAIAVGDANTMVAVRKDGTVWAWGYNYHGQVGNGDPLVYPTNPVQVQVVSGGSLSPLSNVVAVAPGWGHALAIQSDGTLWAWGDNTYGQHGNGTNTSSSRPVCVTTIAGVSAIAAGRNHSLAISHDLASDPAHGYEQWLKAHFTTAELADLSISGDDADPDQDGHGNTQEYRAGTDPTDAASRLAFVTPANNPVADGAFVVCWQSATGQVYTLQSTTNLLSGFTNYITNIPATPMLNVHTDNLNGAAQKFYRVLLGQ